ncbi:MAG: Na/Pi cotransporter family protein [Clostridia bacterium]|nr:Na/Pi cotransporter family protein [Clostridia bacterium]
MSLMNVVSLLAGLSIFLFGMHMMGDELEKAAGTRLKGLLEVVTRNRILAMLAGVAITAVVQSSTATTVMVVGFVNANLLSLTQAVGVIMGANIGTTVTSLLLSIQIDFGAIFCCAGLLLQLLEKRSPGLHSVGRIAMGVGLLFIGMNTMSTAMAPLREWEGFRQAIVSIDNPVLAALIGAAITAVLHSSAASVGILQALAGEGLVPLHTAMFILFGQNIGTCLTALVASSGTGTNARRAAVVHLMFNCLGTAIFLILGSFLPLADWIAAAAPGNLRLQIAMIHIAFNVVTTVVLLPGAGLLERAACLLVRGKADADRELRLRYFDERLLNTPAIAVAQLAREVQRMGEIAERNLSLAMACFDTYDEESAGEVMVSEDVLDFLNHAVTEKLVQVNGLDLNEKDTQLVGRLFHTVIDLERVGDHAVNILEAAQQKSKEDIHFTAKVQGELDEMSARVTAQLENALAIFQQQKADDETYARIEAEEDVIDQQTEALRAHHVERIKSRKCSARNGAIYLDMLTNLERIADHAENIVVSVRE